MHGNSISAVKSDAKKNQIRENQCIYFKEGKERCFKISRLKEREGIKPKL